MEEDLSAEIAKAIKAINEAKEVFIQPRFGPTCELWVRISKAEAKLLVRASAYPEMDLHVSNGNLYLS